MIEVKDMAEIVNIILNFDFLSLINHVPTPQIGVGGGVEAKETVDVVSTIKFTLVFLAGIGVLFGLALAFAAKRFSVKLDPRIEEVKEVLANAHCGACGFAGCQQYAEAVVNDSNVAANLCSPGGEKTAKMVAMITGKIAVAKEPEFARIMCQGDKSKSLKRFTYEGV
ncbi:Electron transport complex, RnfB, partial [Candidatus Magnetoovum chiemensis]